MKRQIVSITALIIIFLVILSGCTPEPDNLYSPTKNLDNDVQWEKEKTSQFTIKTKTRTEYYSEQKTECFIKGTYPQIFGFADTSLEKKVNLWLKEEINKKIDPLKEYYTNAKATYFERLKEKDSVAPIQSSFTFSYRISVLNPDFLSVIFYTHVRWESHASHNTAMTINIDLQKGKLLERNDLFTDSQYWNVLKPLFVNRLDRQLGRDSHIGSELYKFNNISPYLSFAFSPDTFIIIYDENEAESLENRKLVKIPYEKIKNIITYQSFPKSFSDFSVDQGWTMVETNEIFYPHDVREQSNPGLLISFPAKKQGETEKDKIQIIDNDNILIRFPVNQKENADIQITHKDINKTMNPTIPIQFNPTSTEQGKKDWVLIQGIWFQKEINSESNVITYNGLLLGIEYRIAIHLPFKLPAKSDEEKLNITRINQVLGRFYLR